MAAFVCNDIAAALAALPAFPRLVGRRVRLRGPGDDDVDGLFRLFSDPAVMRYRGRPPMASRMEAEGRLQEILAAFGARDRLEWLVVDKADAPIGTCTLFDFDPRQRHAEIGYALRPDLWGRGLAGEAAALAIGWGFRSLGLRRIEAAIDPRNAASRRLLQRLGFAAEAVAVDAATCDQERYALLAQDWLARH